MKKIKTFSSFVKSSKEVPAVFGSIGNRPDPMAAIKPNVSLPAVFGSIGNRPDPMNTDQIKNHVISLLAGKRYKHGFNTLPHKHKIVREWYELGSPLSALNSPKEKENIKKTNTSEEPGTPEHTALMKKINSFEEHYGHTNEETLRNKRKNPHLKEYVHGSWSLNHALIDMHKKGHDINNKNHFIYSAHDAITNLHDHWTSDLTEDQKKERAIRTGSQNHDVAHGLKKLIENSPAIHEDTHVYTGIGGNLNIRGLREDGHDKVHMPAFTSTSLSPSVAASFAFAHGDETSKLHKEVIRIHLPKGSKHGVWAGSAGLEGEHEFILNHGKTLKFNGEPRVVEHGGGHVIVHDAEIHEDDK